VYLPDTPPMKQLFKSKLVRWFLAIFILLMLGAGLCNYWVISSTKEQLYGDIQTVPFRKVGIVLGTNKNWRGEENPFFKYRIAAAAALFKAGKIKHIIVSGDNHLSYYDEPKDMKDELVKLGIPDTCITLDYAGFRTFDSVIRCKEVFGQDSITIVSQEFHNERALFIANYYKMSAIGFNAQDVSKTFAIETALREFFAKCKAVLDLYIFHTEPHFLGDKVKI
jgi:SanA protein